MKKLLKTLLIFGVICSMAASGTVFADSNGGGNDTVAPYSYYYLSGSLDFADGSNYVAVIVSTSAFTYIDSIYHDVTIYKNGSLYSSKRYSDTDCQTLTNNIKVYANSGDVIEVYVDHYTSHNGIVESGNHYDSYMY